MVYLSLLTDFEWSEENTTFTFIHLMFDVPLSKHDLSYTNLFSDY